MCADDPGCCNDSEDMGEDMERCEACGEYDCLFDGDREDDDLHGW